MVRGWRCEIFANAELTQPCVTFIGRFASSQEAISALAAELAEVQVLLYPGQMLEVAHTDVRLADGQQFQMIRYSKLSEADEPVRSSPSS